MKTLEDFGAVGDGIADDLPAITAALNSGEMRIASAGSGKRYRITDGIVLDSRHDGLLLDFRNDTLVADSINWNGRNDVLKIDGTSGVRINNINIDGGWEYAAYMAFFERHYYASMTDGEVVDLWLKSAAAVIGKSYNGISVLGSSNFTAGHITVRNCRKGAFGIEDPLCCAIESFTASRCGGHGMVASSRKLASRRLIRCDRVDVSECYSAFDLSTPIPAQQSGVDQRYFVEVMIGSLQSSKILGRTKIHGPCNLMVGVWVSNDMHESNRYAVLSFGSNDYAAVSITRLASHGSVVGVLNGDPRSSWVGHMYAENSRSVNSPIIYGKNWTIDSVELSNCTRYALATNARIGKIKATGNSGSYPLQLTDSRVGELIVEGSKVPSLTLLSNSKIDRVSYNGKSANIQTRHIGQ